MALLLIQSGALLLHSMPLWYVACSMMIAITRMAVRKVDISAQLRLRFTVSVMAVVSLTAGHGFQRLA